MSNQLAERIARQVYNWTSDMFAMPVDEEGAVKHLTAIVESELSSTSLYRAGLERGAEVMCSYCREPEKYQSAEIHDNGLFAHRYATGIGLNSEGWADWCKASKILAPIPTPQPPITEETES